MVNDFKRIIFKIFENYDFIVRYLNWVVKLEFFIIFFFDIKFCICRFCIILYSYIKELVRDFFYFKFVRIIISMYW